MSLCFISKGTDQRFRIHPVRSSNAPTHKVASQMICPDPFVWQPHNTDAISSFSSSSSTSSSASSSTSFNGTMDGSFLIQCTGNAIKLGQSPSLVPAEAYFTYLGESLGSSCLYFLICLFIYLFIYCLFVFMTYFIFLLLLIYFLIFKICFFYFALHTCGRLYRPFLLFPHQLLPYFPLFPPLFRLVN